jgi:hypothetical protein
MGQSDQTQSESFRATPLDAPPQSRLLFRATPLDAPTHNLAKKGGSSRLFACFQDNQHVEAISNLGLAAAPLEWPSADVAASSFEAEAAESPSCH